MRAPFQGSVYLIAGALALSAPMAGAAPTPPHTVMTFTQADMIAHKARRRALPRRELAPVIRPELAGAASPELSGASGPVSLLPHLAYTPSQWNQGGCGDCWVWGSTAACSIGFGVHMGTSALFSVQFMNSTYNGGGGNSWACCGGDTALFTSFYGSEKVFIPWSNAGGSYADLSSYCGGNSATRAAAIAARPNIPFTGITDQVLVTTGVTQAQAIANIKAALNGGQAVAFGYFLPSAGWKDFESFWSASPETASWANINRYSGSSFDSGSGGHLTCLVGYDDSDATWIVLNSWGTTPGRPDGTFKIPQAMGYNDYMVYGSTEIDQYEFDVYNISWPASANTVTAAVIAPAQGTTVASGATLAFTGTGSDSSSQASLTYAWTFGDGASAAGASVSHTYSNPGTTTLTCTVTLTATDGTGARGTATRTIYVSPAPRNTVSASITSPSATVTAASGAPVSFAGSATDSSRTATLAYAWTFGDGAAATGASASHAFTNNGTASVTETVTFTATDSTGIAAQTTRLVLVNPAPRNTLSVSITNPPVVAMVGNGSVVTFACSARDSSPSVGLTYAWTFGDGTSASGPSPSHKFTCPAGSMVLDNVVLKVTDATGVSATANTYVYVMPQAGSVVSVAVTSPSGPVTIPSGTSQSFTCKGTDSSGSARLTYYWNFGDSICASGATVSHAYSNPTTAPVTRIVTVLAIDSTGCYSENILPVTIAPAGAKK